MCDMSESKSDSVGKSTHAICHCGDLIERSDRVCVRPDKVCGRREGKAIGDVFPGSGVTCFCLRSIVSVTAYSIS